jgi:hypothetical protein
MMVMYMPMNENCLKFFFVLHLKHDNVMELMLMLIFCFLGLKMKKIFVSIFKISDPFL